MHAAIASCSTPAPRTMAASRKAPSDDHPLARDLVVPSTGRTAGVTVVRRPACATRPCVSSLFVRVDIDPCEPHPRRRLQALGVEGEPIAPAGTKGVHQDPSDRA